MYQNNFKTLCVCNLGNCCIKYSTCSDDPSSFSLDSQPSPVEAKHDSDCSTATTDYVQIIGSSLTCKSNNLVNRYCGGVFNPFTTATKNAVVCGKST